MVRAAREWVTFADPKEEGRRWQIDVTFLLVALAAASSGTAARACSPSRRPS